MPEVSVNRYFVKLMLIMNVSIVYSFIHLDEAVGP